MWTREQEEAWATAFEKYISEGAAPTPELESIFEMAKAWLLDTYRNVVNSPLETPLNPEIKDVFDQMLGGVRRPETIEQVGEQLAVVVADGIKQGLSPVQALYQGVKRTLNYKHFRTTDDVLAMLKADEEAILKAVDASVGNKQTFQEWIEHAERLGASDIIPLLQSTEDSVRLVAAKVVAGKQRIIGLLEDVTELEARLTELEARALESSPEYGAVVKQIESRLQAARTIEGMTYAIQREVARGTAAGRVPIVGQSGMTAEQAERVLRMVDPTDPESVALKEIAEREIAENTEAMDAALRELDAPPPEAPTPEVPGDRSPDAISAPESAAETTPTPEVGSGFQRASDGR